MTHAENERTWNWNVETLREYILSLLAANQRATEAALAANQRAVDAALAAAKEAVSVANTANEKRFENTNEWRGVVNDRDKFLLTRSEAAVKFEALEKGNKGLESRLDALEGRKGGIHEGWGWAVGIAGFVFMLITIIITILRFGLGK